MFWKSGRLCQGVAYERWSQGRFDCISEDYLCVHCVSNGLLYFAKYNEMKICNCKICSKFILETCSNSSKESILKSNIIHIANGTRSEHVLVEGVCKNFTLAEFSSFGGTEIG